MALPTWNRTRQWSRMTLVSLAELHGADVANVYHARLGLRQIQTSRERCAFAPR
jgi:hypothetical protein